ncbi:MAG: AAA family ATPase [Syntrophaceae bacterium]|nr:AAA family ATPase [Syntrophaceae bacterium]
MYSSFYGFKEKPFSMTPDPAFLFLSKNHKEAFAHLLYGINDKAGFIELAGEVGSGKTTVLRTLLDQLDKDQYRTALIFNPSLSPLELLQNINREYGLPSAELINSKLIDSLNEFLLRENAAQRTVVLVVDEAQNLSPVVLEQIRLISNLETEKDKLIQILLVGQPELEEMLNKPEMRQIRQRITVQYYLKPMDYEDTVSYINHRIAVAGGNGRVIFSKAALKRIFRYSKGLPRLINVACDRALLTGYMSNSFTISGRMASTAIADVSGFTRPRSPVRWLIPASLLFFAMLFGTGVYFSRDLMPPKMVPEIKTVSNAAELKTVLTLDEFSRQAGMELAGVEEKVNFQSTFDAIAPLLNVPLFSDSEKLLSLDKGFKDRGIQFYKYSGNLGGLLRLDCPAIMELRIPGVAGSRYLALTGFEADRLITAPSLVGKTWLTGSELETLWTGKSYIPWKNTLQIPMIGVIGTAGEHLKRLQCLLKEAGVYNGKLTAVFDKETRQAVKEFQFNHGIPSDGIVGNQTLFMLYCKLDRNAVPSLTKNGHKEDE